MPEPSVLNYARYFGLAQDYTSYDPLAVLDALLLPSRNSRTLEAPKEGYQSLLKQLDEASREYESLADDGQLQISPEVAHYLKSCTNYAAVNVCRAFQNLLPDPHRLRKLKVDIPMLVAGGGNVVNDVRKIKEGIDLNLIITDTLDELDGRNDHVKWYNDLILPKERDDILEWSRNQLEVTVRGEKMEVSERTMKRLRDVLQVSADSTHRFDVIQDLLPKVKRTYEHRFCLMRQEEFGVDEEDDDLPSISGESMSIYACDDKYSYPSKPELEPQSGLVAATGTDLASTGTQADEELEGLFRQFTHHPFNAPSPKETNKVHGNDKETHYPIKRQKIAHQTSNQLAVVDEADANIAKQKSQPKHFKIDLANAGDHRLFTLPELDPKALFGSRETGKGILAETKDVGEAPFRTPTIHEAFNQSISVDLPLLERFLGKKKSIITSDMLLWKEAGLRVLDKNESDNEGIVMDACAIEGEESEMLELPQPEATRQFTLEDFHDHRDTTEMPEDSYRRSEEHDLKAHPAVFNPFKHERDVVKNECRPPAMDRSESNCPMTPPNPFVCSKADMLPRYDQASARAASPETHKCSHLASKISDSQESLGSIREHESTLQHEHSPLRSLLPKSKHIRGRPKPEIEGEIQMTDSLSTFLNLRGKQFKNPHVERISKIVEIDDDPIQSSQVSLAEKLRNGSQSLIPNSRVDTVPPQQYAMPPVVPLENPRTVVVNNMLLQTRPLLIQFLDKPDDTQLTLIYRDLNSARARGPDLILNASTCLTITNSQSLSQRPLPGQVSSTGMSQAHDQIAALSQACHRVIVLIHYTASADPNAQHKTTLAQVTFAAFCHSLSRPTCTQPRIVQPYWFPVHTPASTADTVNAWVWQVIRTYAQPATSPMIQDETLWELFLRRTGLNPLAAQLVIASLERPGPGAACVGPEPVWGMRKLVAMGSRERVERFADVIGWDVVDRLNIVLTGTGLNER